LEKEDKKIKWEMPELVDLNNTLAEGGTCTPGSGASDCLDGAGGA